MKLPEIIVLEATNRCNLDCVHCYKVINNDPVLDISPELVDRVLGEAEPYQPRLVALTGGEPTTHKNFANLLEVITKHDLDYTFTTNGQNFPEIIPALIDTKDYLKGVTFSIEGPNAQLNDSIRGEGTFHKLIIAMEKAKENQIPFGIQTVLSTQNFDDIEKMALMATMWGADELSFAMMRPTPENIEGDLLLTFEEAEEAEEKVVKLKETYKNLKIMMGTGYYSPRPLFVCRALAMSYIFIDHNGHLRFCPEIAHYRDTPSEAKDTDFIVDLNIDRFSYALKKLAQRIAVFWANKIDRVYLQDLTMADYYPCYYCFRYFGKNDCLDI